MIDKKLCIGTAQFGSAYGITNRLGKIHIEEAKKTLQIIKKLVSLIKKNYKY